MFKGKLKYYHGTSKKRWESIKKDKFFLPSHKKFIGDYWITKGAYFVCENPYIALWYAHIASLQDQSEPIVLCIDFEINDNIRDSHLNLLTADGHKLLAIAHTLYKNRFVSEGAEDFFNRHDNLDSSALQMLFSNSLKLKFISACFQEGKSYQAMIYKNKYFNKYIPEQKGFSPGDHIEICFYPNLEIIEDLNIQILNKKDIIDQTDEMCNFWPLVCESLTYPLSNEEYKTKLKEVLLS